MEEAEISAPGPQTHLSGWVTWYHARLAGCWTVGRRSSRLWAGLAEGQTQRCRDGQRWGVVAFADGHESSIWVKCPEEVGGPLRPSASLRSLDELLGLWVMGGWEDRPSRSLASPCTPCCSPCSWQKSRNFPEGGGRAALGGLSWPCWHW